MKSATALTIQVIAALAALTMVSFAVLQTSQAAFSGTTDGSSGNWSAGTVALSDDDGTTGQVAFTNDATMVPGDSDRACITVTYRGDVASIVKLHGSTTFTSATDLGQYLDLTIDEVTGGTCDAPTTTTSLYTGTVSVNAASFAAAHTDWSNGLASNFAPSTSGAIQTYRITVTLQDNNSAQALNTTATFTWEAQNT